MQRASRKPAEAPPPRMGVLAKLPVFVDLAGKPAVVAGGSAGAAWKAELLAAAGADVHVYAPAPGEEMRDLTRRGAAAGSIALHEHPWAPDALAGATVALCDAQGEAEASAFACAARAAGALVNVIDKPAFCDFQFGTIVNRSPVVVAISTDGAAPILGQAIRQRIETLLPPSLADWGRRARDIRDTVMCRLARGPQRRAFWERFAERALAGAGAHEAKLDAELLIDRLAQTRPAAGRVTLVGAGPGDAELLTLKAVRAMQSADIILFDDLVSEDVLDLARREARRMMVGKRGRRESCAQDDINELMIKLARQGKRVVRLKSGDPMIFARAGEEIAALERAGIPVDIVPGITSAFAAAARLGVSLTHRDCAQSVRFVTGHARDGQLPNGLDWRGLADPATTLVFYMAGRTAGEIARRLMSAGLPAATPAVVMAGVARADEKRWLGCLRTLADGIATIDSLAPVLIGIGAAFAAARQADGSSLEPELARPDGGNIRRVQ